MRKKLLIVDDEALIREGLIARLSYLGFLFDDVLEAESGAAALKLVKQRGVDCVITDIQMPDMDGLTFIREAKAGQPQTPFSDSQRVCGICLCQRGAVLRRVGVSAEATV